MLTALHSWAQRGNRFVRLVLALPCIVIALCSTTLIVLRDVDKAVVETSHSSIGFTRRRDATWTRDINSAIERAWPHPRRLRENGGQSSVEGVEIHPMQTARRPRQAREPMEPELAEMAGVITAWKMPDEYATGGGEAIRGVYVLFHGCHHDALNWFDRPEERTIVDYLVTAGYAVVAPASKDRKTGCWKCHTPDGDTPAVKAMLWTWYKDWDIPVDTPLFLYGASSGGDMVTYLGSKGGFEMFPDAQACKKDRIHVEVSGVVSQISWGIPSRNYGVSASPVVFMPMPKGELMYGGAGFKITRSAPILGQSPDPPPQVAAISKAVVKAGGHPRIMYLPLGELPLYRTFFSDRIFELSVEQSGRLYDTLAERGALECDDSSPLFDGEQDCFLSEKISGRTMRALVIAYEAFVRTSANPVSSLNTTSHDATFKDRIRPERLGELLREVLNSAWAAHEMSANYIEIWETWLWDSCVQESCHRRIWK